MLKKNAPVAVFDSGLGGISVLKELVRQMPNEDYLYFGDSANAPYGPRSTDEVQRLTCGCVRMLFGRGCKALVVACNTATSAAIQTLRETYPDTPIIGIEPALKPAVVEHDHPNVLVMATEMTLKEEKFRRLMESYSDRAAIYRLPGPGIVELVERGIVDGPEMDDYLQKIFLPYRKIRIDAVVLGCTHFPFAAKAIARNIGWPAEIYDGAPGTARETERRLREAGLLTERTSRGEVTMANSSGEAAVALSKKLFSLLRGMEER